MTQTNGPMHKWPIYTHYTSIHVFYQVNTSHIMGRGQHLMQKSKRGEKVKISSTFSNMLQKPTSLFHHPTCSLSKPTTPNFKSYPIKWTYMSFKRTLSTHQPFSSIDGGACFLDLIWWCHITKLLCTPSFPINTTPHPPFQGEARKSMRKLHLMGRCILENLRETEP